MTGMLDLLFVVWFVGIWIESSTGASGVSSFIIALWLYENWRNNCGCEIQKGKFEFVKGQRSIAFS
jgi:hypothetical protein